MMTANNTLKWLFLIDGDTWGLRKPTKNSQNNRLPGRESTLGHPGCQAVVLSA
jgi:hypothetical protein